MADRFSTGPLPQKGSECFQRACGRDAQGARSKLLHEVPEERKSLCLTLFRVKLSCEAIALSDGADKGGSVMSGSPNKRGIFWNNTETVVKIELIVCPTQPFGQRVGSSVEFHLIPSDVGNLERMIEPELHHNPGEDSESGSVVFFGAVEQRLHPKADTEKRAIICNPVFDELIQAVPEEAMHAIAQTSHPGENQTVKRSIGTGILANDFNGRTYFFQCLADTV